MTVRSLLAVLADGEFHSGRELGEDLGVSRSAIWKHIKRLENSGLDIFSVKGRGYRIPGGLELLDWKQIEQGLCSDVLARLSLSTLELTIPSTNAEAMRQCQAGNKHGHLYLAEQQSAGRGRRGRSWVSPFARNLYFSLVWRFEQGIAALEGLSLLVGLAIVRAMEQMGIGGVELKWPNDLLYQGRKLAGVLLEVNGEASGQCQVVIGIGINVEMPAQAGDDIDQPWVDLKAIIGQRVNRNRLLSEVLNRLVECLDQFEADGFSGLIDEWQSRNAMQGKSVVLLLGQGEVEGVCQGVDRSGALLLKTDSGIEAFHGGEISVRQTL